MKRVGKVMAVAAAGLVLAALPLAGCGGSGEEIEFWYSASTEDDAIIKELVAEYNKGQGQKDGVSVVADSRNNIDKTSFFVDPPNVALVSDENFKTWAVENLFLDLTEYYKEQSGNYSEDEIPHLLTERFRLDQTLTNGKRYAGKDAALQGLPFGSTPNTLFYNKNNLAAQGITIISASEEELASKYPGVKPHGYAEYKTAPIAGMTASKNLAGETVYKVFNNRIPMNWEEYRYLAKCFTRSYNSDSPTTYGMGYHWWFPYGWSVGGDCMGYNGENYDFTIADKTPNYLVTATNGVTVNGNAYARGEIIRYEDRGKTANIADTDGLYEFPSQYDALSEFIKFTVGEGTEVDTGVNGYGIASLTTDQAYGDLGNGGFTFLAESADSVERLDVSLNGGYDLTLHPQYREYRGGSVYYKGGKSFRNEYLKVIGETYSDGGLYQGDIAVSQEGTKLVGQRYVASSSSALVIPKRSDAAQYEASWKFMRWAASAEGQKILLKTGCVPNQTSLAASDAFLGTRSDLNLWALADSARYGDIGDWAYFENGEWVTNWSDMFNGFLRGGSKIKNEQVTISYFMRERGTIAGQDISAVNIVIRGRR